MRYKLDTQKDPGSSHDLDSLNCFPKGGCTMHEIESQIKQLTDQICSHSGIGSLIHPQELRGFLLGGLSQLINRSSLAERKLFLENKGEDSANGFSPERELKLGTTAVSLQIPRTRSGEFYPAFLNKYERTIPEDYESILLNLLLNSKNFSAVKRSIRSLGLPYRPDQLDELINEIHQEAKNIFSRRLQSDWFFVYIDAKCVTMINESGRADQAVVFTAIGVNTECKKEVLAVQLFWGNESIDLWKKVFHDLKNRGLTRVLMVITDDFSGINTLVHSMFPNTNHQLCHVHLLRNALRHLNKTEYLEFRQQLNDISLSSDFESARLRFFELIQTLEPRYQTWVNHLKLRSDHFCSFAKLPRKLRSHIKSTNPVEGINNHIEIIKLCAGGLFHSEREFMVKFKIMHDSLQQKWRYPSPCFKEHLHDLNRLFLLTFESD